MHFKHFLRKQRKREIRLLFEWKLIEKIFIFLKSSCYTIIIIFELNKKKL